MDHGSTVLVQDPRLAQAMRLMQSRELPVGSSQHLHGRVEVNRCSGTLARALWTWPWRRGQGARLGLGRYRRSSGRLPGALRDHVPPSCVPQGREQGMAAAGAVVGPGAVPLPSGAQGTQT